MNPKFIYLNPCSFSKELCKDIITMFEEDTVIKYEGITKAGLNKEIKDTTDLIIPENNPIWKKLVCFLQKELIANLKVYVPEQEKIKYVPFCNHIIEYFMIQKYSQNKGKYIYHHDALIETENKKHRIFAYLWYLNDVDEGGETEFWGEYKIKPECGKLLIFPACWTYPHCGKMPISSDKYIITGWVYTDI